METRFKTGFVSWLDYARTAVAAPAAFGALLLAAVFFLGSGLPAGAGEEVPKPAAEVAEAVKAGEEPESVLETAVQDAERAILDKDKKDEHAGETPEQAAARLDAEHREKREQERKKILEQAEQFVQTADEKLTAALPEPIRFLFVTPFLGITLWRYLAAVGVIFTGGVLTYAIARRFRRKPAGNGDEEKIGRWRRAFNVAVLALRNPVKLIAAGIFMRIASSLVVTPYHPDIVWLSTLLVYLGWVIYFYDLIGIIDRVYGERYARGNRLVETVRPILLKLVRFVILFIAGMQIYQGVTGQPMFSLLAGLGIGGLALALASQETLQNLLGFAAIALDKSFLVGDAVSIASYDGTVEHVGLRSMRLRTYDGSSVIIPNNSAINSNIVNKNRRPFIRREIRIGLSPLNPYGKVKAAMDAIGEAVSGHEGKISGLPPIVRFADYEPARFVIQALFWYDSEKPYFFDECSRVNLEICRRLSELGVLFAER